MTGGFAFKHVNGWPLHAHMVADQVVGGHFNRWQTRSSEIDNAAVAAGYDL
jgi:hypothetical protein